MTEIFIEKEENILNKIEEENLILFLGDPVRTGIIYLRDSKDLIQNKQHTATNYGLSTFYSSGTTHIKNRIEKGYVIFQLTDIVLDLMNTPIMGANLTANDFKMSTQGEKYIIDSNYNYIIEELKKNYKFIRPEKGEGLITFLQKYRTLIQEQRREKITDEFVDRVNKLYFSKYRWIKQTIKKDLIKHFCNRASFL